MTPTRHAVLTADVRVSETFDRVLVVPRAAEEGHHLLGLLREQLPGVHLRRCADGASAPAHEAGILLDVGKTAGLELRWTEEARLFAENRRRARQVHGDLLAQVGAILAGGKDEARRRLIGVGGLNVLDDHQWVNVAVMTVPDSYGACIFDEQGSGKTVTFIFGHDVLVSRDQVDFALIVAPKSMVSEWPCDYERFKHDLYKVRVVAGSRKEKGAAIGSGADVLVTNFETAVSMEAELRALLRRYRGRCVLVVDESFFIKNLDAKRTRALRRLREWCGRAFVLCGTPAPNAPDDLVQQFSIVDFGLTFEGAALPEDRDKARQVVQEAIEQRGVFVRHLKSAVLPNLPSKRFQRVMLALEPQQQRLYAGALSDLIVDLRAADDSAFRRRLGSFLARRSALTQICSNPASVVEDYAEVPAKLKALDTLLEELICRRKEKVVLWSFYTASIQAIVDRYCAYGPIRYDGTVSDVSARREGVRQFQEDDQAMLFVANPAAAGAGLNLHRARFAIYESMSNQAAHYLQSLDRIHRRGQTRDVEYLVLLCNATIEVDEYERLVNKEQAAQQLLGDVVEPPVTRQSMLQEAITCIRRIGERVP